MPQIPITVFLVDDERKSLINLKDLINNYCSSLKIIGTEQDPVKAIREIEKKQPDVLFLDIQMPNINGFELLKALELPNSKVVFVTAYDEFAIKAIKVGAMDYLLKPVLIKELLEVEKKLIKQVNFNEREATDPLQKAPLDTVMEHVFAQQPPEKILIPVKNGYVIEHLSNIIYLQSEGNYTYIHRNKGNKTLVSRNLKYFEKKLDETSFIRVHNSYIINIFKIEKIINTSGMYLILEGNKKVSVSRRKIAFVNERLGRLHKKI